ncbi:histidine phosphatase family protein [Pleionea sp. CnH1-48]|uniref:histidine phosphatase family protein n=1 Tax=Pleionea sp. CnH1-48 TaxID=2954494 RepID=UPI00209741DE|nr:histidine phosphatase family protein [Pleionea sp. CnH1-48]MCO7226673.1 histidine phosphatase family protein [Pleionea sp. CnH1-48]
MNQEETNKVTTIYLVRHGQTEWNTQRKLQGCGDSPLTQKGEQQIEDIAKSLTSLGIQKIYSSQLGRAVSSSKICQRWLECEHQQVTALEERDFGDWQGQLMDDLQQDPLFQQVFERVNELSPPNGESGTHCANRIHQALLDIASQHLAQKILVVTHGEAMRCLLSLFSVYEEKNAFDSVKNGHLLTLRLSSGQLALAE